MRRHLAVPMLAVLALATLRPGPSMAADSGDQLHLTDFDPAATWVDSKDAGKKGWSREYVPSTPTMAGYRDRWIVLGFPRESAQDPSAFLSELFEDAGKACASARVNGPKPATEDGVSVAYGQFYCGRMKGERHGLNLHAKVMGGSQVMYVVIREFQVPPSAVGGVQSFSAEQMASMAALMNAQGEANQKLEETVYLCLDGSVEARCKPDGTP